MQEQKVRKFESLTTDAQEYQKQQLHKLLPTLMEAKLQASWAEDGSSIYSTIFNPQYQLY